jgi:hypothetical protein
VNETCRRRFIASADPLGVLVRTVPEPDYPEALYEVVGLVQDTKYTDWREEIPPVAFVPVARHPNLRPWAGIIVHSSAALSVVMSEITRRVSDLSPEIGMPFKVFQTQTRERLMRERMMAWLAGAFGVLAALSAMVGVYGVFSYMVVGRRNEIGIRLALGARRSGVVLFILREMAVLLGIGVVAGAVASRLAVRGADVLLFGLSPPDTTTLLASIVLLAAIAGLASALPAWRASRVDPMTALRCE